MATILPFVVRPGASAMARAGETDAAIIIFPGVRYEPVEDNGKGDKPKAVNGASRKKKKSR